MFWELIFIVLGGAYGACTRPTDFHWLEHGSPTNTSFELFSGNSGQVQRIYYSFGHSECLRPNGGNFVIYCAEKTMTLPCQNGAATTLGLGQDSPLWNHYQHIELDSQRIVLSNTIKNYSEKCLHIQNQISSYLCYLENVRTSWTYKDTGRSEDMILQLFVNSEYSYLPRRLFQIFEEAANDKRYDDIYLEFKLNGQSFTCGEDCLFTNTFLEGFELWITPHDNENNTINLNERFLHYKKLKYSSFSQTIEFENETTILREHKFIVQLFLIPKIMYGFWVFARRKDEYCDSNKQELFYELFDSIVLGIVLLEELLMHNDEPLQYGLVISTVVWLFMLKIYEFIIFEKNSKNNFDACKVTRNSIPILILQTMLQELDSYECVMIAIVLQFGLIFYELFQLLFLFNYSLENGLKAFSLVALWIPSIIINYIVWADVFFDEIVSLLGYEKSLLVVSFYLFLTMCVVEIWKRRRTNNELVYKLKFI